MPFRLYKNKAQMKHALFLLCSTVLLLYFVFTDKRPDYFMLYFILCWCWMLCALLYYWSISSAFTFYIKHCFFLSLPTPEGGDFDGLERAILEVEKAIPAPTTNPTARTAAGQITPVPRRCPLQQEGARSVLRTCSLSNGTNGLGGKT